MDPDDLVIVGGLYIMEAFAGYDRLRRVLGDLVLPLAMKVLAKPETMAWQFGCRIDWDANLLHKLDGIQATSRN